jgi:hydroxymethylpyrimidine pyrophosphatase-like HAD family hydrolase
MSGKVKMKSNPKQIAANIKWNDNVTIIISDVDGTIAAVYVPAKKAMIKELTSLLYEGKVLFFITGQGAKNIEQRIINQIPANLRKKILVGACSGAEVWGYGDNGQRHDRPFYSIYNSKLTERQKTKFREVVWQVIEEFKFEVFPTMPVETFKEKSRGNPNSIMFDDRRSQITFEVVNNSGVRAAVVKRAQKLFDKCGVPISGVIAGTFAIDFVVKGVSKETAVRYVLGEQTLLTHLGLTTKDVSNPNNIEVWGDHFSVTNHGIDRHISEALPKSARAIDFRDEDPREFPAGYNIVVWKGAKHLQDGLLEYLKTRKG